MRHGWLPVFLSHITRWTLSEMISNDHTKFCAYSINFIGSEDGQDLDGQDLVITKLCKFPAILPSFEVATIALQFIITFVWSLFQPSFMEISLRSLKEIVNKYVKNAQINRHCWKKSDKSNVNRFLVILQINCLLSYHHLRHPLEP